MIFTKVCVECGMAFEAGMHHAKYCPKCRTDARRRVDRERKKCNRTIEKTCEYCGKKFMTYSDKIRFCDKSCSALARPVKYGRPCKEREYEDVRVRILKPIDCVFAEMQPKVGGVYSAEKMDCGKFTQFYIIRSIGKYGLIVRGDECEEVSDKDVSV